MEYKRLADLPVLQRCAGRHMRLPTFPFFKSPSPKIAVETAPGGPLADRPPVRARLPCRRERERPRRRTPGRRPERSDLSRLCDSNLETWNRQDAKSAKVFFFPLRPLHLCGSHPRNRQSGPSTKRARMHEYARPQARKERFESPPPPARAAEIFILGGELGDRSATPDQAADASIQTDREKIVNTMPFPGGATSDVPPLYRPTVKRS